eukprot:1158614-Pelagomonas_calceolata.AAC.3
MAYSVAPGQTNVHEGFQSKGPSTMSFSLAAGSSRAAQVNKPTAPTRRVPAVPRVLRSRVVVRAEVPVSSQPD